MPQASDRAAVIAFMECLLKPNQTVFRTAHHSYAVADTFEVLRRVAVKPIVNPHIHKVQRTNGQQRIEFKNGSRMLFGARGAGSGRGFSRIDKVVFDEAEHLSDEMAADIAPAQFGVANPETIRIRYGVETYAD